MTGNCGDGNTPGPVLARAVRRTLVVMVREPRAGLAKTRLGAEIGSVAAVWWYRHQVRNLVRRLRDPRWSLALAVTPDAAEARWRDGPADLPRWPQGRGDLGGRMIRMLRRALPGPVCLVGSDIPELGPDAVWRAFKALGASDVVFGPATDGGFWLVGIRRLPPRRLFESVRWSTRHALEDSLATIRDRRVALVDCLSDVDRAADLRRR